MKKNIYKIILALSFVLPICHISYAQTDDDWRKMVNKNLAIVERERQNGIKNVGEYISATVSLAYLYNNAQKYDSVVYYGVEADSLLRNNLSEILGAHINFLALIAQSFFYLEDYNQAASYQEDMISLEEYVISHGGKTVDGYVPRLSIIVDDYRVLASLTREIPDQEATKHALQQAIKLMEDNDVVDSCENAGYIYGQMSFIYFDSDSLDLAISYVEKEGSVYERWYGKKSEQHKKSLRLMRLLFNQKGDSAYEIKDYQSALINFSICDSIFKLMDDTTSEDYYSNVIEMGRCYENMGMDARALTILEPIEPVLASLFGKESSIYIEVTSLLASLNSEIQQYEKSYSFRQREYNTSLNDTNVVTQALSQLTYASVLDRKGEVDSAILCLKGAINGLGDSSLESVLPYSRLLAIYAREGDTNKCDSIERICKMILNKNVNHLGFKECEFMFSTCLSIKSMLREQWDKAELYSKKALDLMEEMDIMMDKNNYLEGIVMYTSSTFANGHKPAQKYQKILIDKSIRQFIVNNSLLSSAERDSVINGSTGQIIRNTIFSMTNDSSDLESLYNYSIFCKQQTLNTDIETARSIILSEDSILLKKYELIKKNGNNPLDERRLRMESIQLGGQNWIGVVLDSIKKELHPNDLAVEYIRYMDYGDETDKYIALLARKDWDEPRYIPLCKAEELPRYTSLTAETIYGGGYVSEEIERLLFDPIKEYTKKGGRVYFAPDGILYNLAIENILTSDGKTLGEKYGLVRCSSTRNITQIDNQPQYASAVLYGGLDYGGGADFVAEATTRKGWNYLPGTLQEVNIIGKTLGRHKVKTEIITGKEGTESSFAQLSGKGNSILHLATHGFFYTASSSRKESFFDYLRGRNTSELEEISPMQRSGLLLSNGNKTWMSEKESEGSDDGVLLASEVISMNLFGTELLVLSACQTGLGDMSVEGIMGLQRAFKLAGVKTIVMSLWEVDDAATAMMMEQFYGNLMSGKSKRKAFSLAQQKVRKKYPTEPQKWAAFIMLD